MTAEGRIVTVVLARTGTPEGEAALNAAILECRRRSEDLLIFAIDSKVHAEVEESQLEGVRASYREPDARGRDAVGDLLDVAQEVTASAIVIGLRHRTPVGKLLLGSAAQQILLEAPMPVIAVKADPH